MGDLCAELCEFFGCLEVINDLLKLFLFLVCARYVLKRNFILIVKRRRSLCLRLAEAVDLTACTATHGLRRYYVHNDHKNHKQDDGEIGYPCARFLNGNVIVLYTVVFDSRLKLVVVNESIQADATHFIDKLLALCFTLLGS